MNYQELDEKLGLSLRYQKNFDIERREIGVSKKFIVYYLSILSDDYSVERMIESILKIEDYNDIQNVIYSSTVRKITDFDAMVDIVFSGQAVLIPCEDIGTNFFIDVRKYPSRGIEEPETEKSMRGAKDGFNENFATSIALIRRRIKSSDLCIDAYEIGKYSKTLVALMYMENTVNQKALANLKKRLEDSKDSLDSLVMSDRALEETIFRQRFNIYPLVRYTERPDITAIQILKGHIAIICDTSNSVIITPISIFDHLQHVEEFRQVPLIGMMMRLLRLCANILSILIIPLWLIFLNHAHLSTFFYASPEIKNYPIFIIQILLVEIMFEILRIATIHTPSKLSNAMGLVAALILGQIAVEIGIFIPEILLYCSISAIGGFATPSYELSLANKVVKIILILMTAFFGIYGLIAGVLINLIYLANIKVLGVSYLYPLIPFEFKKIINFLFGGRNHKIR